MFASPGAIVFQFGPLAVRWYRSADRVGGHAGDHAGTPGGDPARPGSGPAAQSHRRGGAERPGGRAAVLRAVQLGLLRHPTAEDLCHLGRRAGHSRRPDRRGGRRRAVLPFGEPLGGRDAGHPGARRGHRAGHRSVGELLQSGGLRRSHGFAVETVHRSVLPTGAPEDVRVLPSDLPVRVALESAGLRDPLVRTPKAVGGQAGGVDALLSWSVFPGPVFRGGTADR